MIDFMIGLGQGGSRIAREFRNAFYKEPGHYGVYMNLTENDFAQFDCHPQTKLALTEGGTGKDPELGERLVRESFKRVNTFLGGFPRYRDAETVLVAVGGGGGSGAGFLFPVMEKLLHDGKDVLLVITLPERRERLPTVPNALFLLERVRTELEGKVSILPVDNNYLAEQVTGDGFDYWLRANRRIVAAVRRFVMLAEIDKFSKDIDMASGFKAIDYNDIKRVLFSKSGFLDVREVILERMVEGWGVKRELRSASLTFKGLDIGSTRSAIVAVGLPDAWKFKERSLEVIEEVFDAVDRATRRAPDILRSSYFNRKLDEYNVGKVSVLLSGLTWSKELERLHDMSIQLQEKMEARGKIRSIDLSGIDAAAKKFQDR